MKFKVGDKVRDITKTDPCYGLVGVVKELCADKTIAVDFEMAFEQEHDANCGAKHGWWVCEKDLEMVAPACVEKEHIFSAGEVVIATGDAPKGYKGIVRTVDKQSSILVEFPGWGGGHSGSGRSVLNDCWWMHGKDLVFVEPDTNTEKLAAADIPTPEAEDNTADITAAELPKGRLIRAFEKYEAAVQQENEALEEIEQILKEMRKR